VAGNSKTPGRSVISKVSAILLALAEGRRCSITEIAARTDLPLSTVHRLATELAAWRVLEREDDGRFRAGSPLRVLGGAGGCAGADAVPAARDSAAPVIEDLFRATGVPVRIGFLDGTEVAYIQKTSAVLPVSEISPAARLPAHASALGKALLAFAPPQLTEAVLARRLPRFTPRTVIDPERLRWTFRRIRAARIAFCDRELNPRACAVAMPVFGALGNAVAAVELEVRDLAQEVPLVRGALTVAAGALSRELGHGAATPDLRMVEEVPRATGSAPA
jgi:DNA-binding IclR family transcriptional regulator